MSTQRLGSAMLGMLLALGTMTASAQQKPPAPAAPQPNAPRGTPEIPGLVGPGGLVAPGATVGPGGPAAPGGMVPSGEVMSRLMSQLRQPSPARPSTSGQPPIIPPMMMRMIFTLIDSDSDGTVSLQEFQAAHERIFKTMDANRDGKLTLEEMQEFMH